MIDSLKTGSFMKNDIYAVKSLCDSGRRPVTYRKFNRNWDFDRRI